MISLEYFAGFFDGEGCISTQLPQRGQPQLVVVITNTYYPILQEYQKRFGGTVYERKKERSHHKTSWVWRLTDLRLIAKFLTDIRPLLVEKRPQADVAVEILIARLEGRAVAALADELRRLKGRPNV